MTSIRTRIVAVTAALATAVVVSSCTKTEDHDHSQHSHPATTSSAVASHNADDIVFAQMMIPHHQQAVELAALAPEHSTNPALLTLATTISAEQQPEIQAMKALLLQWEADPNGMPGHDMQGMVDDATMTKLGTLNGPAFDTLWLQSMIGHHQGAIEMANTEIAKGKSADMIAMAKTMVSAQQAEINQMKQMLGG